MKKTLAIMLTLILTFSCFSILGISTVSAETQQVGQVILESDFNDADGTNWQATHQTVTYSDDNGDGVNDYASVKVSSTKKGAGLVSSPFNLIPGNEYELTYYIRVPEESVSFKIGSTFYTPTTIFYQPTVNSEGTRVSSTPAVSTEEASNNYYAYKGSDWVRREGFKSTWTIDGYEPTVKSNFSNFGYADHGSVLSATNTDLNAAFANWTKVTVNFTAMAAVEGETSQVTALAFTFHDYKSSDNFVFDLKDVKLVCTNNGTVTKTIMQSDFNDADGTNWQATKTDVLTYGDDNSDGVNDYARVKIHPTSKNQGLVSSPFNLIPGNEYELTYYIRVPEETADGETASFLIGSTFYAPTVAFYQPTVNAAGTKVTSTPSVTTDEASNNYYAYKGSDWSRREGFKATWTIDGYEPTVKSNFSNFGYLDHGSVLSATNETINDAFADWTKVTVNFTAMEAVEGETSQVAALSFTFHDYKSTDNFVFDIKDVTLTETAPKINPEPDHTDAIFYEDFESSPNPTDVVTVYSGASQNATWVNPTIISSDAATGLKAYSAFAMYQDIFIPFDKSKLQADTVYSFSMDWMLNEYTSAKQRRINNVYAVGYTPTEGVTFKNGYEAFGGKGTVNGTGNWEALSFNFKITEDKFNKYEQIGIYISYSTSGTNTDPDDRLYLDTLMLKVSENQDVVNELELNEADRTENTVKVLAFGNSFSNDGTSFIPQIAYADGVDLRVADCSIGGCTLAKHYNNSVTNASAYSFAFRTPQSQGTSSVSFTQVTMEQALTASDWDYITIQQVSTQSGDPDSFEPYLGRLIEKFKEYCPNAKIVFQMTWAYRDGIVKDGYEEYDNDQETMYNAIVNTYLQYAEKYDVEFIIPSGETIQSLRALISDGTGSETDTNMFSSEIASTTSDAGDFTRDGYHLSQKGRVAAAFTWYEIFTGISALDTKIDLTTSAYGTLNNTTDTLIGITEDEALAIKTAAHNAASLYKKAVETIKAIKAIGEVTADSGDAIETANTLRAELNDDGLLPNLQTLIDANEAYAAFTPDVIIGDANGDNTVNLDDVNRLAQYLAGWDVTANEQSLDTDGDGVVNLNDLVLLAQFVAGWDVELG